MLAMNSDFTLLASCASMRAVCSASQRDGRSTESASNDEYSPIREFCFPGPAVPLNMIRTERLHSLSAAKTRSQSITCG